MNIPLYAAVAKSQKFAAPIYGERNDFETTTSYQRKNFSEWTWTFSYLSITTTNCEDMVQNTGRWQEHWLFRCLNQILKMMLPFCKQIQVNHQKKNPPAGIENKIFSS